MKLDGRVLREGVHGASFFRIFISGSSHRKEPDWDRRLDHRESQAQEEADEADVCVSLQFGMENKLEAGTNVSVK